MTIKGKILGRILVTGAILMSFTGRVESQGPGGGPGSFGGELRGITQFTGHVVCIGCSLQEARKAQPHFTDLYQLSQANPRQGQVVMQVESFSDPHERMRWESIVGLSHLLQIRATEQVFKELTAEENLFKKLTVTGLLRSTSVLDIDSVEVNG
jgi:hypothetical protein